MLVRNHKQSQLYNLHFLEIGSEADRLSVFNAVLGVSKAQQYYSFPQKGDEDVNFDLVEIDSIPLGQEFSVTVHIQVCCINWKRK